MHIRTDSLRVDKHKKLFTAEASDLGIKIFPRSLLVQSHRTGETLRFEHAYSHTDREGDTQFVNYTSPFLPGWVITIFND